MKVNNAWFSIILGMWLVILITLSAYVLLAYIVPFSKNVKWIENASNAYYQSYAWVEKALYHIKTRSTINIDTGSVLPTTATGFNYTTFSSGFVIPQPWEWNSEYHSGYNIVSMSEPLQLEVWGKSTGLADIDWSSAHVNFVFKVPDFDNNIVTIETLSGGTTPVINWSLSTPDDTLYASGSYITAAQVNDSISTATWNIAFKDGFTLTGSSMQFQDFHDLCNGVNSGCTLKMGIVSPLKLTNGTDIPYLEYKIDFDVQFPDRYTRVKATGKSFGFQKELEVKIPQQTVNQALDFTVFQ